MVAIVLGVLGVLIIAVGVGSELLKRSVRNKQEQRDAALTGLAEEFAATAEAVLEQVDARTARLEQQMHKQMQQLTRTLTEAVAAAQRSPSSPTPAPESAAASSPAALPPRVQQVASLAGTGLTPQAIASRLHMSKSEVEVALLLSTHL